RSSTFLVSLPTRCSSDLFTGEVALLAGIISAIGYAGFTGAAILAGAKLAAGTFAELDITTALWIMGTVVVVYTVMGGLKAVIYTDRKSTRLNSSHVSISY